MRRYVVLVAAVVAVSVVTALLSGAPRPTTPTSAFVASQRDYGEVPPDEWLLSRRLAGGTVTPDQLQRASDQAELVGQVTEAHAPAVARAPWRFQGPKVIGGRIVELAVDPVSANTVYAAAASGGVWKSIDAGGSFQPAWPTGRNQALGALTITASGKLYAGAGETNPSGYGIGGKGVWVSSDSGAHWRSLGLEGTDRIGRIAIDPADERRIFVAAVGPLFAPGGERGVYLTKDGGQTWSRVLQGANDTTGASDVLIDPLDSRRVYAVMWDHFRQPFTRRYGGRGSGIYRSENGGRTWKRLAGGLPRARAEVGRIGLGLAPSNPDRLYAIYVHESGIFKGFYTSANGGDAWTKLPYDRVLAISQARMGWWFGQVWVDPAVETHVFVAGLPLVESTTGGGSWKAQPEGHADQHALVWDPKVPGRVYLGNDGGVYRSETNGAGGWSKGPVQPFTQFYSVDVSEQDPARIVAGSQDNGCGRSYSSSDPNDWNVWACGDGLETLISFENQDVVYGCSQYGNCVRSLDGGETIRPLGPPISDRRNWWTPLVFDPNDADVMYWAGEIVNRSTDGGQTWTAISPDLTGGDPDPGDPQMFGTVTTLAPAKSAPMVVYAGTDDGRVWYTRNLGLSWVRAADPDLPERWVTRIAVDPADANVAYATFSGFRRDDDTAYVLATSDGGESWIDITGNLPQAPVNVIAVSGSTLVVGSDVGVFLTQDGGAQWLRLGRGLPSLAVLDLRVHEPTKSVYAATYGRGVWKVELPKP